MKKIYALVAACLLMTLSAAFPGAGSSANAQRKQAKKTTSTRTKKHGAKKSTPAASPTVGTYADGGISYSLLENGKVKVSDKCVKGSYDKRGEGAYYVLKYWSAGGAQCGDFVKYDLIVGNEVYQISLGSTELITNFNYDKASNSIYVTEIDDSPADKDMLAYAGLKSNTVPLSNFKKIGTVTWTGTSNSTGGAKTADPKLTKALDSYAKTVKAVKDDFYVDGEFMAPMGSGWRTFIVPVIEEHDMLKKQEGKMTDEQKARFDSLNNQIKEIVQN